MAGLRDVQPHRYPFCGDVGGFVDTDDEGGFWVTCGDRDSAATSPVASSDADAIRAWNRRHLAAVDATLSTAAAINRERCARRCAGQSIVSDTSRTRSYGHRPPLGVAGIGADHGRRRRGADTVIGG